MDLLKTILVYLTMVFVSSVQMAPEPSLVPVTPTPATAEATMTASITPTPTPSHTPVPTPDITPNSAYKTVKVGDRGEDVLQLQRRLTELGYYTGEVDGAFGNQTRRSVERFQYQNGLSVDGIAGKRTLTVLYESTDVVLAPADTTSTPVTTATAGPTAAMTAPPVTATPAPTFAPSPTPSATPVLVTDAPEAQISANNVPPATDVPTITLSEAQDFVLSDSDAQLMQTILPDGTAPTEATPLHPLLVGDQVFVPVLDILRASGSVVIPGVDGSRQEYAFSIQQDVYQLSYRVDATGAILDLQAQKNQSPLILTSTDALLHNGTLYLPMTTVSELTHITFTPNEALTRYTVAIPNA